MDIFSGPPAENDRSQQRQLHRSPPVLEQAPPPYNTYPAKRTRRQPLSLFSTIRSTPITPNVHHSSPDITPSIYAAMPPSYAELFLTPHTLTNQ